MKKHEKYLLRILQEINSIPEGERTKEQKAFIIHIGSKDLDAGENIENIIVNEGLYKSIDLGFPVHEISIDLDDEDWRLTLGNIIDFTDAGGLDKPYLGTIDIDPDDWFPDAPKM